VARPSPRRVALSAKGGIWRRTGRCRGLPDTTVVLHPDTTVVLHPDTTVVLHPDTTVVLHPDTTVVLHPVTSRVRVRGTIEAQLTTAPTADHAVLVAASATAADMRILLVEDDKDLQRLLKKALSEAGYVVDVAADGEEGHFLGDTEPYDAVVLDLGLPKMDGVTVLERWRKAGRKMPVLILTARDRWSDKVAGFDAGADDYVAKPFYTEELLARLRALLRRAAGIASADIEVGPLRIDTRSSRVTVEGNPIKLTSLEYRLLAYLAHHKGQVLSRTDLVEHLYDQDFDRDSNTIEVFIGRLRKKLGVDVIHTVRGLGYRLDEPSAGGDES
jgi:two-component system, OmpR family, response regulator